MTLIPMGKYRGDGVMAWIIAVVALSLVITVLAIVELRQPVKVIALGLPDRLFVVAAFTTAFMYGLTLLAAKILL
jgi:hypothetical protein